MRYTFLMADIWRIETVWAGVTGLPGVTVMYGNPGGSAVADIKAFFNAIKALFPAGVSWQIPVTGDTIDVDTGALTGGWADAAGGTVTSTGSGIWASGTGTYVTWSTGTVVHGRRLKGRTFLAPLFGSAFQSDGTIVDAYVTTIQTAADALVAGGDLMVWHRPHGIPAGGGIAVSATAAQAHDQVTSLRTRRS